MEHLSFSHSVSLEEGTSKDVSKLLAYRKTYQKLKATNEQLAEDFFKVLAEGKYTFIDMIKPEKLD